MKQERKKKYPEVVNLPPGNMSRCTKAKAITNEASSWVQHLLPILVISVISICIYANTIKNGFVYDDVVTVVNNPMIKDFRNLPKVFQYDYYFRFSGETSYRPVVTLTYFLDYALYGLNPWGYHLTNLILHVTNGAIFYLFLALLIKSNKTESISASLLSAPFFISLLFVTHPTLTEAVNAISFREDLLVFMLYMATISLYLYMRPLFDNRNKSISVLYGISALLYFFALLSKEMAATLPIAIYFYEFMYGTSERKNIRSILIVRQAVGYIAVTFFYLFLRFYYFNNPAMANVPAPPLFERLLTIPWLLTSYLKMLFFPFSLSADYSIVSVQNLSSILFILPLIAIVFILFTALKIKNIEKGITFGIVFYIISLMPVYNIIPIDNPFAERYLYLSSAGFMLPLGMALSMLLKSVDSKRKVYILAILLIIPLANSITVVNRNGAWRDSLSLWADAVRKMPDSARAHLNLGDVYARQNRMEEAIKELTTAIRLEPDYADPHYNLGLAYFKKGDVNEAIKEYLIALKYKLKYAQKKSSIHYNLGLAYHTQGRLDYAIKEYLKALELKPDHVKAYNNLGYAYFLQGKLDDAIREFLNALSFDPRNVEARSNLGLSYFTQGKLNGATKEFLTALEIKPDYVLAHRDLGRVYYTQGRLEEAGKEFSIVLQLVPNDVIARQYLEKAIK